MCPVREIWSASGSEKFDGDPFPPPRPNDCSRVTAAGVSLRTNVPSHMVALTRMRACCARVGEVRADARLWPSGSRLVTGGRSGLA